MNFFKLYIGDYQRDTAHMTIAEHGAYMLMLQHYYATEKPLPSGKSLHRMLRAQDKTERDAIDAVVAQFWIETDAGIVNERADAEITKANTQAETNGRIAREREDKRKAARTSNESSTNRATNDEPNHSHSQTIKPTSQPVSARDPEKFAMRIGWEPSAHVADLAKQSGAPLLDCDLPELVAHWLTEPSTKRTQAEWDKALLQSAKHRKLREVSPAPPRGKAARTPENFAEKNYGTEIRPL